MSGLLVACVRICTHHECYFISTTIVSSYRSSAKCYDFLVNAPTLRVRSTIKMCHDRTRLSHLWHACNHAPPWSIQLSFISWYPRNVHQVLSHSDSVPNVRDRSRVNEVDNCLDVIYLSRFCYFVGIAKWYRVVSWIALSWSNPSFTMESILLVLWVTSYEH